MEMLLGLLHLMIAMRRCFIRGCKLRVEQSNKRGSCVPESGDGGKRAQFLGSGSWGVVDEPAAAEHLLTLWSPASSCMCVCACMCCVQAFL